jgi:hypothetical protein
MPDWISINQDQSEHVINTVSSFTKMLCVRISQSLAELYNETNFAPSGEYKTYSSCIGRLFYLSLFDPIRWRILRNPILQFHSLGLSWIRCVITTRQRQKWRSKRLYIPRQNWWMLWDVIGSRLPLFKNDSSLDISMFGDFSLCLSKTQSLPDMLIFYCFVVDLSANSIPSETSNTSRKYWCSSFSRSLWRLNVQKHPWLSICSLSNHESSREKKRKAQQKAPVKDTQTEGRTMHDHRWRTRADRWNNWNTCQKQFLLSLVLQSNIESKQN